MEDAVTTRVNYSRLDESSSRTRIRLNSTAVHVRHNGEVGRARDVSVVYVRGGRAYRVRAQACVDPTETSLTGEGPDADAVLELVRTYA